MRSAKVSLLVVGVVALGMTTVPLGAALAADYRAGDVEECIQKLYSDNWEDRGSAGEKLSEMGKEAKAAVPRLIEIVQADPHMSVRGEAAKALGNMGPTAASATPALIELLQTKEAGIERAYAATALGQIGAQPDVTVKALADVVANDDQPTVRQLSARALGDLKDKATAAVPVLIEAIRKGDKDLRNAACDALATIPAAPRDVPALIEMLGDEIDGARVAAAKSLTGAGDEAVGAVPPLIKLLQDKNERVRVAAVQSLGNLGRNAKAALPPLKVLAKDPMMKSNAEEAIAKIKSAR